MMTTKDPEKQPPFPSTDSRSPSNASNVGVGTLSNGNAGSQALHRKLRGKEVQLFAIGGAIGTCELNPASANLSTDLCIRAITGLSNT